MPNEKIIFILGYFCRNFYFADDAPEKQAVTLEFFNQITLGRYYTFISEIVFREIDKYSNEKKSLLLGLIAKYKPYNLEGHWFSSI